MNVSETVSRTETPGGFSPYWDGGTLHCHRHIAEAVLEISDHARQ